MLFWGRSSAGTAARSGRIPPSPPCEPLQSGKESEGERKPVTILFANIVGSDSIAGRLDSEEGSAIVSGALRRVTAALTRHEGTVARL
jgi:class 3 adenylate cyclase